MKILSIIFLTCILIIPNKIHAQDINFSQFQELPLLRNPSLAGLFKGDIRATTAFRSQWQSVTTPYVTQALGVEYKFASNENSNNYFAVGLQITNDQAGDSKLGKSQLLPVLTFHKALSENKDSYLSLGFMGGIVQQRFDVTKLSFDDQFVNGAYSQSNPTKQLFSNTNVTYIDGAAGLAFSSTFNENIKYYLGGSWFHFNKPRVAFDVNKDIKLNNKFTVNAGLSTPTGDNDKLTFYVDYFLQGGNNQTQGGVIYNHDLVKQDEDESICLSVGGFIRWNDAIIPILKLDYYKLGVGMSYDINISKLSSASKSRGGFEVTLSYRNFLNIRNSSLQKTRCPINF